MDIGSKYELQNAGFRAMRSLNCEKGLNLKIIKVKKFFKKSRKTYFRLSFVGD